MPLKRPAAMRRTVGFGATRRALGAAMHGGGGRSNLRARRPKDPWWAQPPRFAFRCGKRRAGTGRRLGP
jgi:hypothetical protein